MFTDLVTRKQRLSKKVWVQDQDGNKFQTESKNLKRFTGSKNWNLIEEELNKMPTLKLSKTEKVVYTIIVLFFVWYIFQAVSFIAKPAPVATSTKSVVDYSNLQPLPKVNWNFTPINQR